MVILPLIVVLFLSPAVAAGQHNGHVRAFDAAMRAALAEGRAHSPLFRDLLDELESSDVIVFVKTDCFMPSGIQGRLTFMAAAGGQRYVMVRVDRGLAGVQQIAMVGHELRHAVEIANAQSVVDQESLAAEYQRIGFSSHLTRRGAGYDSKAAIDTGQRIWQELNRRSE